MLSHPALMQNLDRFCQHDNGPMAVRVLLVTSSLQCGGAERVLVDMANYWAKKWWQVSVATWSGSDVEDFYQLDSSVCRLWMDVHSPNTWSFVKLLSHYRRIKRLRAVLSELQPDVVVSFIDWSNILTILACFGLHTRLIISERVHPAYHRNLSTPWKVLRRVLYRRADVVVAQTKEVAHWLDGKCGTKAQTIPNALRDLPYVTASREHTILAVGRLSWQKGFDLLLQAFASIQVEFDGWEMIIAGGGPERENLMNLCSRLSLLGKVKVIPPVRNIEKLMARASLVVQPSRFEGFPNVVLEAMGMGAAVVSADCPSGPSELIQDGVNGRLVPVGDVRGLADMMRELLADPDQRLRIGRNAERVRQTYGQARVMQMWENCIFQVTNLDQDNTSRASATAYGRGKSSGLRK